jgi:diguanylate cyclase (GGDEF)-like protein
MAYQSTANGSSTYLINDCHRLYFPYQRGGYALQLGFKAKLMAIMGVFSILLTVTVSLVNHNRAKEQLISGYKRESSLVEDIIVTAVSDADKAFMLSDSELEKQMRIYSAQLIDKYRSNPDIGSWDYQALKRQFNGMDIYIINDRQQIVQSSFLMDIGLDFRASDGTMSAFADLLAERLKGDAFIADGLDQETNTGLPRKFSYEPTPDHKYLIELGVYQDKNPVFQSFNFLEISQKLSSKYSYIQDITVYTTSGKAIGRRGADGKSLRVATVNRPTFDEAKLRNEMRQLSSQLGGQAVVYRYVPYSVQFNNDIYRYSDHRVIEIIYNEQELLDKLAQNKHIFLLQLLATIVIALIISYIISRLVAKPLYLASHDWLTGLANRAYFEHTLATSIVRNSRNGHKTALLHIDLDNFKQINDTLGHDAGDAFLIEIGKRIRTAVQLPGSAIARLGGDEFVVILNHVHDEQSALLTARNIIDMIRKPIEIKGVDVVKDYRTTASIGIAFAPDHAQDADSLYNCADQALYCAKRSSKNTYCTYERSMSIESTG